METNKKNLAIGILIAFVAILLYVYVPYEIKERRGLKHKKELIDSLKCDLHQIPRAKTYAPKEKLYYSKVKSSIYTKEPLVINSIDGSMDIVYKDTVYMHASQELYINFLMDVAQ
ncbi:MAG: hypothetical protein WAZ12_05420 [Candidatus Absconditicoccaceae bacterium]